MSVQVPILQRHKDEAFKAFGVVNGTIHEACAQACANVDYARTVDFVWNLVSSKRPVEPELLAEGLGVGWEKVDEWASQILDSGRTATREDVERLVLSVWK